MSRFISLASCCVLVLFALQAVSGDPIDPLKSDDQPARNTPPTPAKEASAEKPIVRVYPVADLVVPFGPAPSNKKDAAPSPDFETLLNVVHRNILPKTWDVSGGQGTAKPYLTTLSLAVRNTSKAHDELVKLLTQLRRTQDIQVAVEMKYLRLPEDQVPVLGAETKLGGIVLGDDEIRKLIKTAETTGMGIVAAPKVTFCSGQSASIMIDAAESKPLDSSAFGIKIRADVAPDRRSVTLKIASPRGTADDVLESVLVISAADHSTVLCDVTRLMDIFRRPLNEKSRGPLDSPLAQDVLRRRDPQSKHTREFLLLTPRIIIAEEEEELLGVETKSDRAQANPEK